MEIRHFKTFIRVVEKQSFSKAAESLGYTQAAVTIQIKQMEDELNMKLFDRINNQIYLTDNGEAYIHYANAVIRTFDEAVNFKSEMSYHSTIRVGTVGSLATAQFPEIIKQFHQIHPHVEIKLVVSKTPNLIDMLNRNEIDLVYTLDHMVYGQELTRVLEKKEKIVFVSNDESLTPHNNYSLKELSRIPFLLTEKGEAYRFDLERYLAEQHLILTSVLEVGNIDVIINVLLKGMGIALLPYFSVNNLIEEGKLFEVDCKMPTIIMYSQLFHHEKKYITQPLASLTNLIDKINK